MGNKTPAASYAERKKAYVTLCEQSQSKLVFAKPAQRVGSAGGTAAFYTLSLEDEQRSEEQWLGKDLSHAFHELEFYESARVCPANGEWKILKHMMEYGGSLKDFPVQDHNGNQRCQDLLVLRNLLEGLEKPRLLDVKIGSRTASAGWRGKSSLAARKQDFLDAMTNSLTEGVRLEGFLNPPSWIDSEDPLHEFTCRRFVSQWKLKKAKRFFFQRMTAGGVLAAFIDLRDQGLESRAGWNNAASDPSFLRPCEYAEILLLTIISELASILRSSLGVPVPQKWVGSSIAIVAEVNGTPPREEETLAPWEWTRERTKVRIFDWGRSQLNTREMFEMMTPEQRSDHEEYWDRYQEGLVGLVYDACRHYWNHFCVTKWAYLAINVYDYDSQSNSDFLGHAKMALPSQGSNLTMVTLTLVDQKGLQIVGHDGKLSQVHMSIGYEPSTSPSRFAAAWSVHVVAAEHLVAGDGFFCTQSSDPYVVVSLMEHEDSIADPTTSSELRSSSSRRVAMGRTSVKIATLNPVWNETIEFAVAPPGNYAEDSITFAGAASPAALAAALQHGRLETLAKTFPLPRIARLAAAKRKMQVQEFATAFMEGPWTDAANK